MNRTEILDWLREDDPQRLEALWQRADAVRRRAVGDEVHLRGLIEFSNHCVRRCTYCGLHAGNGRIGRYRMSPDEILGCAVRARQLGYGTVVLQSGQDPHYDADGLAELVARIKQTTGLAVTLSVGERSEADLVRWRQAGADRYLLRFETSNPALYARIHPSLPHEHSDRVALLGVLRRIGFEVGSGVMVGIPGQTMDDLAADVELMARLDLDMIGIGPFLPHPDTPLAAAEPVNDQAPNSELMTYKMLALARIACPYANIPATTALATVNRVDGRELGLKRGANVVMPNLTPNRYRRLYEIYPAKACLWETPAELADGLADRIRALGRQVGLGPGDSPRYHLRQREVEVCS